MTIAKTVARILSPAEVVITVTKFQPVLSSELRGDRDTAYIMRLKRPHRHVSLKDDIIFVEAPGAAIRLTIASAAGDKNRYYPAGITFVREDGKGLSEELLLGRTHLPQRRIVIDGQTLTFTDRFKKGKETVRYKFSVVIQRGRDGAIGIIDPGIENNRVH